MKTINVSFEDEEYKKVLKEKNGLSWRDFMLGKSPKDNRKK